MQSFVNIQLILCIVTIVLLSILYGAMHDCTCMHVQQCVHARVCVCVCVCVCACVCMDIHTNVSGKVESCCTII